MYVLSIHDTCHAITYNVTQNNFTDTRNRYSYDILSRKFFGFMDHIRILICKLPRARINDRIGKYLLQEIIINVFDSKSF